MHSAQTLVAADVEFGLLEEFEFLFDLVSCPLEHIDLHVSSHLNIIVAILGCEFLHNRPFLLVQFWECPCGLRWNDLRETVQTLRV